MTPNILTYYNEDIHLLDNISPQDEKEKFLHENSLHINPISLLGIYKDSACMNDFPLMIDYTYEEEKPKLISLIYENQLISKKI